STRSLPRSSLFPYTTLFRSRLARWFLMTQDRLDSESLPITHDFLATMLGTGRPSVSLAAGILQKEQIVKCTRGAVKKIMGDGQRSEEHTSELQSRGHLVCRL